MLEEYRQLTGGFKNERASREPVAPRDVETSGGRAGMNKKLKAVILVVAVVLRVAALLIWLVPGLKSNISSSEPDLPILKDQKDADRGYIAIPARTGDQAQSVSADVAGSYPMMWAVPTYE